MEVDEALPEAAEHVQPEDVQRAQQEALDQAQAEAADWTATSLPSQPAKPAAQVARENSNSVVITLQPDPNDIGSREEMLRRRAAPPPWCHANPKRWVVIDLEYFPLSGASSSTEGDTLAHLWETWPQRQPRVWIARNDIGTVVQTVGKRGKRRDEILWPCKIAWAYMTP